MNTTTPLSAPPSDSSSRTASPASWTFTLTIVFVLAAAWLAAGSTGLLAHPLRRGLVWFALGAAILVGLAGARGSILRVLLVLVSSGLAVALSASDLFPVAVLAPVLVAAGLAAGRAESERAWLHAAALAVVVFALYRLVLGPAPGVWLSTDGVGRALGDLGAALTGKPVWVGASFGGVDALVLVAAFLLAAWWRVSGFGPGRFLATLVAAALAHVVYLVALAFTPDLRLALDELSQGDAGLLRSTAELLKPLVPWNVPALACVLQLLVVGLAVRWTSASAGSANASAASRPRRRPLSVRFGLALAAALLAWFVVQSLPSFPRPISLQGKKIVAFEKCYGNWDRARHGDYGRLSIGMYGMMPAYIQSLGGTFLLSKDLSNEDLKGADVLVLLYPYRPWEPGQLDRIHAFVRGGGGLLILGEHTTRITVEEAVTGRIFETVRQKTGLDLHEDYGARLRVEEAVKDACRRTTVEDVVTIRLDNLYTDSKGEYHGLEDRVTRQEVETLAASLNDRSNYFNQVLAPTAMSVRFDSATFEVGGWLHSYERLLHPTTVGLDDDRNQFGAVIGASVECRAPARPVLVGQWGWNDPGDLHQPGSMMGNSRYDGGEKLGDLVLAAEQSLGKGRIIAFGDTSNMTNGITMGAYRYTSRLLAYLARAGEDGRRAATDPSAFTLWLAAALALVLLVAGEAWIAVLATLVLSWALTAATDATFRNGEILPHGHPPAEAPPDARWNQLAYVDACHLGRQANESWRMDGLMGLKLGLMRSGYLVMELPEVTPERLERAGLFISVAPQRRYSAEERKAVRRFVENGGIFILTASYPDRDGSRELLAEFDLEIGAFHGRFGVEPQPMGHFKAIYRRTDDYVNFVRYHEAWPVACTAADAPPPYGLTDVPLNERAIRRYTHWYTGKAMTAVFPWMQSPQTAKVIAGGGDGPVILVRPVGRGKVMVVGDTGFAMNKNLEIESGQAFEGLRENPHFWRWILTYLRGGEIWLPPRPVPEQLAGEEQP